MASPSPTSIRIWDLPTRLFHWTLAAVVCALLVTGMTAGDWMEWHMRLGEAALALLLFRLCWGLVGGRWSRFSSFLYSPAHLLRYLRGHKTPLDEVGHSPAGALSTFALLLALLAQGILGLFSNDDIAFAGPLSHLLSDGLVDRLTGWHKLGKYVILALILLHLAAIVWYSLVQHRPLVSAMLTGNKSLPPSTPASQDGPARWLLALVIAAACAGLLWWIHGLGAPIPPAGGNGF